MSCLLVAMMLMIMMLMVVIMLFVAMVMLIMIMVMLIMIMTRVVMIMVMFLMIVVAVTDVLMSICFLWFQVASLTMLMILQARSIILILLSLLLVRMLMLVAGVIVQQPMGVRGSPMQYFIKDDIDKQPHNRGNQHDDWLLHELLVNDSKSSLIHDKKDHCPNDEDVGKGPNKLHSVIPKRNFLVHLPSRIVQEHKSKDKTYQVANQMDSIRDYGYRPRNSSSYYFYSDEDSSDSNDHDESAIVLGVVLRRWWTVEFANVSLLSDLHFQN